MAELSLAQSFALIALNAQRSLSMTTAKKVALRCTAAAVILDVYLNHGFTETDNQLSVHPNTWDAMQPKGYLSTILKPITRRNNEVSGELFWWLKKASTLSKRKLVKFERTMANDLKARYLLEEIPNLLGCDLLFYSSGVEIKEYRSNAYEYSRITEGIRADFLEEGPLSDENICMLWLFRESGCMHDFFSGNELEKVSIRMEECHRHTPLGKKLFSIQIHHDIEMAIKYFLNFKKSFVKTQGGSGLNFVYPILERSQSVFIDTEKMLPNARERLHDVLARLEEQGHKYTVLHEGVISIIKIDNIIYEAVPHAIIGRIPIHGVRLLPRRPL
ncbi:hypothetical protein J2Z69_002410 [Paenibacillus shirakamiensis]|uniref:Uncharacterized protein n=1 Tax=Paenibacillus shirakamiensis TaxID=1265935 RepID=A0ABS4JI52_9BACL|nr:hypothetical protein [Paenibacillus shirakamiensis]MBP2001367.1 hypothetical protein [Paenibacillus shirakamiensis]